MLLAAEINFFSESCFLIFSGNTLNIVGPRYVNEFVCSNGVMRVSVFDRNVLMLLVNSSFSLENLLYIMLYELTLRC